MLSITSLYPLDARSTCSSRPDNHKRLQILSTIPRGRGAKIPWLRTTGRGLVSVGRNSRGCQIWSRTEPWVQLTGQELDTQQSWSGVRRLRFGDCSGETTRPPGLIPDDVKETGIRAGVRVWMGWTGQERGWGQASAPSSWVGDRRQVVSENWGWGRRDFSVSAVGDLGYQIFRKQWQSFREKTLPNLVCF